MVALNSQGEIADFINENQFEPAESAFICCAFDAALCFYAGRPGHGPTGNGEAVDQLADSWYARLEGGNTASNRNGMSLPAEYTMLAGMQLPYAGLSLTGQNAHDIAQVKLWLTYGYPVILCGAETGMVDLALGDIIPYAWPPTGNHCIVACGIASDGNLLVRDTASIAPTGVRPGPRHYDASRMQLVSATAIQMPWLPSISVTEATMKGEPMDIDITTPGISSYYTQDALGRWVLTSNPALFIMGDILKYYKHGSRAGSLGGLTDLGLPTSLELLVTVNGKELVIPRRQTYERGDVLFDPNGEVDAPPGHSGTCYMAHIDQAQQPPPPSPVVDPRIADYQGRLGQINSLSKI